MLDLSLSANARVKAYNVTLYIADGTSVHSIDLLTYSVIRSTELIDHALSAAVTLEYWITNSTLITVLDRTIWQIDPISGQSESIMTIPTETTGSGPIARATNFGDMYFVTDNQLMYLMNLRAKALETTAPWPGMLSTASRCCWLNTFVCLCV
jgi:hypothetical protein